MLVQWKVDKLTSNQNDESRQSHVVRNQNASERILRANVADIGVYAYFSYWLLHSG